MSTVWVPNTESQRAQPCQKCETPDAWDPSIIIPFSLTEGDRAFKTELHISIGEQVNSKLSSAGSKLDWGDNPENSAPDTYRRYLIMHRMGPCNPSHIQSFEGPTLEVPLNFS